jgi:hypothetical protein
LYQTLGALSLFLILTLFINMDEYEEEQEEELHEDEEKKIISVPLDEEIKLQNDLAKEFQNTLKIPVTDEPLDIGPTPYKVAIIGMNELGSATAFLLICRQVVTDVIIIDRNTNRLAGININKLLFTIKSILAEYADLSTCTTFVSGVNVQASNQLASCEGARVVILCDVNDDKEEPEKPNAAQSSSHIDKTLSNFKTTSRAIGLYGV